ncbi:MAG: LD-carboxypeptidase [Proteobacteria bacterium]|nr:LD-carboxypeptidase [Pseudomonadota bacterium]MCP4915326.1 LD-carboxypeptidase [Pseudomonadota bacterium]
MLQPGARVGVFAPSGAFDPTRLAAGMALASSWGLELVESPNLRARHRYLAGTDEQRLADLEWALGSPELDACWMARGGYGITRLLDRVDWDRVADRPMIGFSDGTALLVALRQRAGVAGVHGPVLHSLADLTSGPSRAALRDLLLGGTSPRVGGEGDPPDGPLVGGNLCVLADLCGTPDQLDARGCVLLLEEIGEPAYKLDRMLRHLRRAGVFDGTVGVVLGQLTSCHAPEGADYTAEDVVLELLGELGVPLVRDAKVGHGRLNRAFVFGAPYVP